ncbi:MAG: flagellar export chaperone FliS [Actinomycetota bacterium]|jgi:flagellar protein FliS|nr:flagellar export chaperone FliS [Actinomycetota bacterium]MDI7251826.1 flagellar export chaperone FliS [Actinomycetota bacterium]
MYDARITRLNSGKAADAYRANQAQTATPMGLIVMLYEGAVSFLDQAEKAARAGNWETAQGLVRRAQDVVYELMGCLDMEKGGRIAVDLFRIYEYLGYRLVQAQVRRDPGPLEEVRGHLSSLREAWVEAEKKLRSEARREERSAVL